jgi:SAM-dependent methyltransferase
MTAPAGMPVPEQTRPCPICGSDDESRVFAEARYDLAKLDAHAFASRKLPEYMHYRLVRCPTCDLVYASPVPSAEGLARAYDEAAFDSAEEARCAARTYGRLLGPLLARLPDLGTAIDVGTGDGAFLEELAAAGFETVIGVEPSAAPIAAARPHVRPWIRHGTFREADFPAGEATLVTCFQTLEHLPDPAAFARSAWRLLKPGGAVLFVGHDYGALPNRLMGRRSPIYDIEHLQLFSRRALGEMLRRTGFTHVHVRPITNRYPLHYWLKLAPLPTALKLRLCAAAKASWPGRLPVSLPVGNLAAVGFKPGAASPTRSAAATRRGPA